ncbi:MAG: zinc ribbon domain-containing protein [Desulfobacterales bacterium]|nr:zinc ribbon domain-containing protein [Desulfobacterales bacterium]
MPTYEYQCEECKDQFSLILSIAEHDEKAVTCPKCKSKEVKQIVSTFIAQTSRKS